MNLMLWSVAPLFGMLKAFVASTRRAASVSLCWKTSWTMWTAVSTPAIWPADNWRAPVASWMSPLAIPNTALAMILLGISPTPIDLTPGFLFKAMSRQDSSGAKISGSMYSVHRRLVHCASDWQRALDADLYLFRDWYFPMLPDQRPTTVST